MLKIGLRVFFCTIGVLFFTFSKTIFATELKENTIPVFLATDEKYAPIASVMMKSVLMHTESFIDFYVMDGGIKEDTKELIKKDLQTYSHKNINFVDMSHYNLETFPSVFFTKNSFSRYFIPKIIPQRQRAIYLDVDIILRGDIRELYDQDMENYPLAAMSETKYFSTLNKLFLKSHYPQYKGEEYFNSGVLLMDIQKLNEMDFFNKVMKLTHVLKDKSGYLDQDALNILFENNYKSLTEDFNFLPFAKDNYERKYPAKKIEPIIVHYASQQKPWLTQVSCFQEDFDRIAKSSVFYKWIILLKFTGKFKGFLSIIFDSVAGIF